MEESCAASASCCKGQPSTGMNWEAWRLPRVMVPVLSSNKMSTSPAASIALPLMARTFAWLSRLIPAMPMAESNAPMVVGARQTNNATKEVMEEGFRTPSSLALNPEYVYNDMVTKRKMIDSATSRICSAISLGVFLRVAPSTMAIILSRKLCPGSWVTRTTRKSDRTLVPPVTALRSPPASLITGADSPVMALSSTDAAPWTTSPSAGIISPSLTMKKSPRRRLLLSTSVMLLLSNSESDGTLWAMTSWREERNASAWAFPRPSAIASAKFANRTVSHKMQAMAMVYPIGASEIPNKPRRDNPVVRMAEM